MKLSKNQLKEIRYFLEYILVIPFLLIMRPFSIEAKSRFGVFVGRFIMYPFLLWNGGKKRYTILVKNLEIVLGRKISTKEAGTMVKEYCANIARIFTEGLGQRQMTKEWLVNHVSTKGINELIAMHKSGKTIIVPSAHIGNWEIAHKYLYEVHGIQTTIIYRKQNNLRLDHAYVKERTHVELIEKRDPSALKKMLKSLNNNRILVILLDQRDQKNGEQIEFFGNKAPFATAIARLAIKNNAYIYCGHCYRLGNNKFILSTEKPIIPSEHSTPHGITQEIFNHFEQWIKNNPLQWFCLIQDIWKK